MSKKAKAVDFASCVSTIEFIPEMNSVSVRKVHYSKDSKVLSTSFMEIPLNSNTFETAMQIASAIASNVGLVTYEEQ